MRRSRSLTTAGLSFVIAVLLMLSGGPVPLRADVPPPVTLTILHVNDVYEIDPVEGGASGGLSRVASVLTRLRATGPVLATLGGDFLSPSAIGTARIDGEALGGRQMVDVLDALGLDWAVLGNHEFDVSETALRARLKQARFRTVATNVTDGSGRLFENTVASAVVPVRVGGRLLRIGLIGLTIDSNRKAWVRFADPIAAARTEVAGLRGRADAIVALTHLNLAVDQELAASVPEIDLILGGHEHENWFVQRGARYTPIIKADSNARSAAIVSLRFARPGERPVISSRLQRIDATVPKQPRVERVVRAWVARADAAFQSDGFAPTRVLTTLTSDLDGRESVVRNRPGPLTELILDGIARAAAPVDVAIVNGGSIRIDDVLPAGPLTELDTIRILPFGGKVLKVTVDGALLVSLLDTGTTNQGTGGFLHLRGAVRASGGAWTVGGRPVDPAARYTVAVPEYLLTGQEVRLGFFNRTSTQVFAVEDLPDIRMVLINSFSR